MHHNASALPLGAGRAVSGPARRRPLASPSERLAEASSRLDRLMQDVSCYPNTSHRETERRIGEAESIAEEIRAIFRLPTTGQNKPLWEDGKGKAVF